MLIKYINVLYSFIIHFFLNSNTVWYLFVLSVLFTLAPRWAQMSDGRFLFLTSNNTRVLTTLVFTSSHAREINKIIPPRRRSDNIRPYRYIVRREENFFYFLRWLMYGGMGKGGGGGPDWFLTTSHRIYTSTIHVTARNKLIHQRWYFKVNQPPDTACLSFCVQCTRI